MTGIGETRASIEPLGVDAITLALEAVEAALDDAGLSPSDIDGLLYSPFDDHQVRAVDFHAHFGTSHEIWESPEGGGMVQTATAPHAGARAIGDGRATHVLNTCALAWSTRRDSMVGGPGQGHADNVLKRNLEIPFGFFPQPVYAGMFAQRHMAQYGTTREQLGAVALAMREHANRTPGAVLHDRPLTMDAYLNCPIIAEPLGLFDCCMINDSAAAYVLSPIDVAQDLPHPVVEVTGCAEAGLVTQRHWNMQADILTTAQHLSAPAALELAGIGVEDLDVLLCYDAFTIVVLQMLEDIGFCERGESGPFVEAGGISVDGGVIPTNPHGGLMGHSYLLGFTHLTEAVRQLRGTAANQVEGARSALVPGIRVDISAALILQRAG